MVENVNFATRRLVRQGLRNGEKRKILWTYLSGILNFRFQTRP